ncbi:hypothetical protein F5X71_24900 [Nocardia brasiliensis]|uniref:Uncharacterized protein n=1 Tax=Nocardia brasiliensis TaxID=37326 RepID=A0A6G9XW15_NOCBR|nr:hypothetical protein [Nocardia brasiliensis]QIS05124.1 hypothetical protein F5X71_24900 [Nocardia brasiliensis]
MAQGRLGSPYWVGATAALAVACVVELSMVAFILRLRDPEYLRMPAIAFLIPVGIGLAVAAVLRKSASNTARGCARGALAVSVMIAITGLLAGLLYRGGWI